MEYTAEEKNRLEIDKLSAEVADLRSWVRRWLGAAGGLLGIVTAAVSIIVASYQVSSSAREAQTKSQQADARLAAAERLEAKEERREIMAQTEAKNKELAAAEKRLNEITEQLAGAEQRARALAVASVKARPFSTKALDLLVEQEGVNQPGSWPGGDSGITIGIGYDLRFVTKESLESDWQKHLPPEHLARLVEAVGLTGKAARVLAPTFRDIKISRDSAIDVFERVSLPQYQAKADQVFPGYEKLPLDAQGALIVLLYNRGTGLEGDRNQEMRAIRDLVPSGDLPAIAAQIRSMKRLWAGQGFAGLIRRREAEAVLLESAK